MLAIVVAVGGAVLGFVFAGSPTRIAAGVQVDGVDVGGLTAGEARTKLERRAEALAGVPVTFTAAGHQWALRPVSLGVQADWNAAVKLALDQGDGVGPIRGFRRIGVRVFGADVSPPTRVLERALDFEVARMAKTVNRSHEQAAIVLRGLRPVVVPARTGEVLDREQAGDTIVHALASFQRGRVALPVRVDAPTVRAADLAPVAAQVRTALARPVRMQLGSASWWLPKRQLAAILQLPRDGAKTLSVGGTGATRYFARLGRGIDKPARDATFRVLASGRVVVAPARPGRVVAALPTGRHILAAALAPQVRTARVVVTHAQPKRSTAQAKAMGITRRIAGYETIYGGDPESHPQRPARRAADRREAGRAGRDLLLQRRHRRAHGRQGLPRGARDHQRRGHLRARRRCVPGLDDRLQRRLRGRPEDHRADEPRPLHQPLPAGPRRDRQLPRRRPQVR